MKIFEITNNASVVLIFLSFLILPKFLLASECVFDVNLTLSTKTEDIFHSCNSEVIISYHKNLYRKPFEYSLFRNLGCVIKLIV